MAFSSVALMTRPFEFGINLANAFKQSKQMIECILSRYWMEDFTVDVTMEFEFLAR